MREAISTALKQAQKSQDKRRMTTLRLINAAIQDRDIQLRGAGKEKAGEEEITDILTRMVKQREESTQMYRDGGRPDLEAQETEEIAIIREFLPQALSDDETAAAIADAIGQSGAQSLRDMGKVMGHLREHYRGQIDMAKAGAAIKKALSVPQ